MDRDATEEPSRKALLAEIERLRARLDETEQTVEAIRTGDVDALVVHGSRGEQLFTLEGADRVYRTIVETMHEAALTVGEDGTILFCNRRFCEVVKCPMQAIIGQKFTAFAAPPQHAPALSLLADAQSRPVQRLLTFRATDGSSVSAQLSASRLMTESGSSVCVVATDLSELEASASSIRVLREQQQALEESLATLQSFYHSSTFMMGVVELEGEDAVTVEANPAIEAFFGVVAGTMAGRTFGELGVTAVNLRLWLEHCRRSRREGRPLRFEHEHPVPAGARWLTATVGYLGESAAGRPRFSFVAEDVTERRQAAAELLELNQTLEQRVAERTAEAEERAHMLRLLAGELAQAEQRERRRVAELLHDGLQQLLFAARLQVGVLRGRTTGTPLHAGASRLDELLDQALQTSRGLTAELAPPSLYFGDLAAALRGLVDEYQAQHGLTIELTAPSEVGPLEESVKVLVFQGVRELLLNVVKHAGVTTAQVGVAPRPDGQLDVTVSDRGRGFAVPPDAVKVGNAGGFGLFSVGERIALLGGELQIDSRLGEGTRATLVVPFDV